MENSCNFAELNDLLTCWLAPQVKRKAHSTFLIEDLHFLMVFTLVKFTHTITLFFLMYFRHITYRSIVCNFISILT